MTRWLENGRGSWETNSTQASLVSHPKEQSYFEFRSVLLLKDLLGLNSQDLPVSLEKNQ